MTETEVVERQFNVLVYGLERKNLPVPSEPIKSRNYSVSFERFETHRRFQEYDGVIMFQGIFESFQQKNGFDGAYLEHTCDRNELDKRKKEVDLLLGKGGFLCFLLTDRFLDDYHGRDLRTTDLAKYFLNCEYLFRKNFPKRKTEINSVINEFKSFLEHFGAANSFFENHNNTLEFHLLAEHKIYKKPVGMILNRSEYYLPSLTPDRRIEAIQEYFEILVDAVTSVHNKLHQAVPEWVAAFKFDEEPRLIDERASLMDKVKNIDQRIDELTQFKAALVHSGAELVADVSAALEAALGIKVDAIDDFREDIKLIGDDGNALAVCEIKGINRGIKRENINQTDSHRERSGYDEGFPAILIANTNIKQARSIAMKAEDRVDHQQVRHAVHMHVLIMRTIDLLGLLRLVLSGKLTQLQACNLVLSNVGWLRIQSDEVQIVKE
jgi:hypothetical protein